MRVASAEAPAMPAVDEPTCPEIEESGTNEGFSAVCITPGSLAVNVTVVPEMAISYLKSAYPAADLKPSCKVTSVAEAP